MNTEGTFYKEERHGAPFYRAHPCGSITGEGISGRGGGDLSEVICATVHASSDALAPPFFAAPFPCWKPAESRFIRRRAPNNPFATLEGWHASEESRDDALPDVRETDARSKWWSILIDISQGATRDSRQSEAPTDNNDPLRFPR
jgi:hypothetical protein